MLKKNWYFYRNRVHKYRENKFIAYDFRFFYGKNLEYINRNLKSNNFENLLPIFKLLFQDSSIQIINNFKYDPTLITENNNNIILNEIKNDNEYFSENMERNNNIETIKSS